MEKSMLDLATDILMESVGSVKVEVRDMFKGKKPFRKEPISAKEKYYYYRTSFTPDMERIGRQQFGDGTIDQYKDEMEKLGGRYQNG